MLATILDDTWNVLSIQHITPISKRWDYSGAIRKQDIIWANMLANICVVIWHHKATIRQNMIKKIAENSAIFIGLMESP